MYKKNELFMELENLEYDLESKKMELEGLKKEYHELNISIIYYICPFLVFVLFYMATIGRFGTDVLGQAFSIVLGPIVICIGGLYVIFVIKKIWYIYLNRNSERARTLSERQNIRSVSKEIERCTMEMMNIEMKINEITEQISELNIN